MTANESRAIAELISELKSLGRIAAGEAAAVDEHFGGGLHGAPGRMAAELRGSAIALSQAALLVERRLLAFTDQDVVLQPAEHIE